MKSQWNEQEASAFANDPVKMRTYTSRLLGREPSLVLHGGGNTSVKVTVTNLFNEKVEVLYVKGSGWDLATIEPQGFAPVRMDVLHRLARLENLSDADMVREQKAAMINPDAPGPSIEAILHAIIPFKYVEHTHADAVVALTNTPKGEELVRNLYGKGILFVPYVMPGFILARKVFELTQDIDWKNLDGMILLNHGVFTFSDDAREAYEKMIELVTVAEDYIADRDASAVEKIENKKIENQDLKLAKLRKEISQVRGTPVVGMLNASPEAIGFSNLKNIKNLAVRGTLTPDHVIHTKPKPLIIEDDVLKSLQEYSEAYKKYFDSYKTSGLTMLDAAPRWAIWPGRGTITFGVTPKAAQVVNDISKHTQRAIQWSEKLGGWTPLEESKLFEVEYWELEQAKIKKKGATLPLQGKIALVTGAANGIGLACVQTLQAQGAAVVGLDINPRVTEILKKPNAVGIICDVTKTENLQDAVEECIKTFGGLDILISNAGSFPVGKFIADLPDEDWDRSFAVNLTSHERLIKLCAPFLKLGVDPSIVIIASKNVPAPGPGAAAYSVAKAGLTQLARVAALELAGDGVRVNVLHPDAVFDTGIWTEEILANRAKHYGMTIDQYKRKNLLRTEVSSADVARLACALAGSEFSKTTGAQIPVDGGNDRVI